MASGSTGRAIVIVCVASLLLNVLQFNRSMSYGFWCDEQVRAAVVEAKRGLRGGDVSSGNTVTRNGVACPPCLANSNNNQAEFVDKPGADGEDEPAGQAVVPVDAGPANEIGWDLGLARVPNKTDNTVYDPKNDAQLQAHANKYGRSPVPKGSWKVRVADNKWITMDEAVFAYDVWFEENQRFQYMNWLGVFVQQDPTDAFAIADMLYRVKPDLVIEIGTNTGGGAIFYSTVMRAYNPSAKIVTLDVVPQPRNWNFRKSFSCPGCIMGPEHPYWNDGMITYIQGRVTEKATRDKIQVFVDAATKVLVIEDASHRYPDTLENIEATYHWVSKGSYLLVQDTKMDRFVGGLKKKYGRYKFGPMRSVDEFMAKHGDKFVIDRRFEYLLYSQHHRGWLLRK